MSLFRSEDPPAPGNLEVEASPASAMPTIAMLKADIDSGNTGGKIAHYDVGMVQLGTCNEAAGTPPTPERIALARKAEAASLKAKAAANPQGQSNWVIPTFIGFIVVAGWLIT